MKTEFTCGCWIYKPEGSEEHTGYHLCFIHQATIHGGMPEETAQALLAAGLTQITKQ